MSATSLIGKILGTNFVGFLIGKNFNPSSKRNPDTAEWYNNLNKSPLNPPNWVFAPVWTTLYTSMTIASYIIANDGGIFSKYEFGKMKQTASVQEKQFLRRVYIVHLIANFLYSPLFFGKKNVGLAQLDVLAVAGLVIYLYINYKKYNTFAATLFIPYIAWSSFASYLNFYIWRNN